MRAGTTVSVGSRLLLVRDLTGLDKLLKDVENVAVPMISLRGRSSAAGVASPIRRRRRV